MTLSGMLSKRPLGHETVSAQLDRTAVNSSVVGNMSTDKDATTSPISHISRRYVSLERPDKSQCHDVRGLSFDSLARSYGAVTDALKEEQRAFH
jgi:hypothetical protein